MDIKVGDKIKFTVNTKAGKKTATRVVNGFWGGNSNIPTVKYEGWEKYSVNQSEIIEHIKVNF